MSKILITGATGFIGGYLVEYFLNKGKEVVAHGSSPSSISKLKKKLKLENVPIMKLDYWIQDFLAEKWTYPDFSNIEIIIHCAALTKVREGTKENYDKYFGVNVLATKRIAEKALEEKISHFIHISTGQVYGIPDSFPINDSTPKNPINLYGATKLMSEDVVKSHGVLGLRYSIIRPFSVYGRGHHNIISIITEKLRNNQILTIFGDGTQSRVFSHVKDLCKAVDLIANNIQCFGEEYNVAGPKEYSVNQLVELISKILKKEAKIEYKTSEVNELLRNVADLKKVEKLGLKFESSLEEFLKEELNQ